MTNRLTAPCSLVGRRFDSPTQIPMVVTTVEAKKTELYLSQFVKLVEFSATSKVPALYDGSRSSNSCVNDVRLTQVLLPGLYTNIRVVSWEIFGNLFHNPSGNFPKA